MDVTAYGLSDIGLQREKNEDSLVLDHDLQFYAVCDGMGGYAAGEVAAAAAIETAMDRIRQQKSIIAEAHKTPAGYFEILKVLEQAAEDACREVYQLATSHAQYGGMGTTLTMLLVVDDKAIMAHVGDSRLYISRRGSLHLLSHDHTLAHEMLQAGMLTPEAVKTSPYNHALTRCIGREKSVPIDTLLFDLLPSDVCLLCSDGLSKYFRANQEVIDHLENEDLERTTRKLVELAKSRGGNDNITAIVVRVSDPDSQNSKCGEIEAQLELLRRVFLCKRLSLSRLMRVLNITDCLELATGDTLVREGEPCESFFIVSSGQLEVLKDGHPIGGLSQGVWFGETSLARPRSAQATVRAARPSQVLAISRREFSDLVKRLPKLGTLLLSNLTAQLGREIDQNLTAGDTLPEGYEVNVHV